MSRILSLAVFVGFVFSAALGAQGAVSGAWDLAINGPEGMIIAGATLKQDGEALSGTIDSPQGTAEMTGTMKGTALALTFSIQGPQGPLDIKINAEVDGDAMKGVLDFGMGTADFTGKKK
jgi:hypothetical protein